jgi:hypothetical protein
MESSEKIKRILIFATLLFLGLMIGFAAVLSRNQIALWVIEGIFLIIFPGGIFYWLLRKNILPYEYNAQRELFYHGLFKKLAMLSIGLFILGSIALILVIYFFGPEVIKSFFGLA